MKKENKLTKFISFVLLITIIALILVAGTYAKYTSTATGSDTATVAKWDIKAGVEGSELSITGSNSTVAFNLFDTILDSAETADTAETDVSEGMIAPGTRGKFELSVKNDSEVNAAYTVNFELVDTELPEGTTLPLEFKVNDGNWTSSLDSVAATALNMGESNIATVQWRWAYESTTGDANDTTLGINKPDLNVKATLVVTQVD